MEGVMRDKFQMLAEEVSEGEFGWYWLSFVKDAGTPEEHWAGGCFVQAWGIVTATAIAHFHGINPGGEVACWGPGKEPPEEYRYKLITDKKTIQEMEFSNEEK